MGFSIKSIIWSALPSAELLRTSDLVIAMSTDHQASLVDTFQYRAPLFNEICHGRSAPLLDIWEATPTWETDIEMARQYAFRVMEYNWASTLCLLQNLGKDIRVERAESLIFWVTSPADHLPHQQPRADHSR